MLLEEGLISQEQLDAALAMQAAEGGFLGRILVRQGFVSQEAVASALVKQCKIPHLSLLDYNIGPDVLQLIPAEVCRQHHVLPIDKLGRILTVAMVDPLDLEALQAIRESCPELRIKPILCNWEHYAIVSEKVFGEQASKQQNGGQHSLTAESLGLRAAAPAPKPEPPRPQPATAAPAPTHSAPAAPATPAQSSGAEAAAIAQALQSTQAALLNAVREGFQDIGKNMGNGGGGGVAPEVYAQAIKEALRESLPASQPVAAVPAAGGGVDMGALANVLHDSVGGAFQEALAALMVKMRAEQAAQPSLESIAQLIASSQAEMAEKLSQSLRGATVSAPSPAAGGDAALPPEALAALIRDSVGGAMQEAMAALLVQIRAMGAKPSDGDSIAQVVSALREAQAETSQKLEQIAESALQSVQQAALLAEQVSTHENQDGSRLVKRGAHSSVMPFHGRIPKQGDDDPQREADQQVYDALETDQPTETFNFSNFIAGKANAFTFKLAQAVAAKPGGEYNPFFLFGSVGLGKTHLISAIGNAINEKNPSLRVGYVSASHFSRRLSEAASAKAMDAFRENYCCWEVLILDDIQFLGGRVEAQEEFFHIFNTLHRAGRQIIIASDKAPDRLGLLEKRLVSRFASGIVAELKAPEWEARVEILRQAAQTQKAGLPDEILNLVAMRVPKDIRKMTGSLRKIIAYSDLVGQEISCESASEILSHLGDEQAA
ncbi:MAG: chromosomal replication initiator protein DnaA [Candidatus Hydrogenedentota bacterium]